MMSPRARLLAVLWAAGLVSIVCNVLAADGTAVSRGVAAWPPVALLLVVEVLARSPLPVGRVRWAAIGGATVVAVVAAVASFHHMHEVALAAGESPLVAILFPLSVDGLAVVASVALLGSHGQPTNDPAPAAVEVDSVPEPAPAPASTQQFDPAAVPVTRPRPVVVLDGARTPELNGSGAYSATSGVTNNRSNSA